VSVLDRTETLFHSSDIWIFVTDAMIAYIDVNRLSHADLPFWAME
jgi:hypothetical protein